MYTMTMNQTKVTKGTVVFTEDLSKTQPSAGDRERPHTFYVLKETHEALEDPETIVVTITHP